MTGQSVLVVEDDTVLREALALTVSRAGYKAFSAEGVVPALDVLRRNRVDFVVSDVNMDGQDGLALLEQMQQEQIQAPVLFITAYADVEKAVRATRLGAVDFLMKPFEAKTLLSTLAEYLGDESSFLPIAKAPASAELLVLAARVARADSTVLLLGESGVGKEVIAHFIHASSQRRDAPFVAINCAAIPENMLEATLFGYEKGAYTGAHASRPGKFEQADGGTLLLDEISEMDISLQAKLLRVLQEKEVERLGSKTPCKVDVRVIATSNRRLLECVQGGTFREDLYYRVSVFPLTIAPLRERRADINPLLTHMFAKYCTKMKRKLVVLSDDARELLNDYLWPGNVRELENVVQRALIVQSGETIEASDILFDPAEETVAVAAPAAPEQDPDSLGENLMVAEFQMILDVLRRERGSRSRAAEKLGISARTLRYKLARMRESGLDVRKELSGVA